MAKDSLDEYSAKRAFASTPELAGAHPLDFRMSNAAERLARTGDRWEDAPTRKQSLERALKGA